MSDHAMESTRTDSLLKQLNEDDIGGECEHYLTMTQAQQRTAKATSFTARKMSSKLLVATLAGLVLLLQSKECLGFTNRRGSHFSTLRLSKLQSASSRRISSLLSLSSTTAAAAADTSTATAAAAPHTVELPFTAYCTHENSRHTPVVFLHGLLGSKRNFASLVRALDTQLDQKRTIYGVDLRNHGDHDSDNWRSDMSYPSMADDVLRFLDQQQLSKVVLVAHSMGGKVAQAMALKYPDRIEGLVVLDMAPVAYQPSEPHWKAVSSILHTLHNIPVTESTTKQEVDKQLRSVVPDPALRAFCLTNWCAKSNQWAIPVDILVQQLDVLAAFDIEHQEQYEGDVFFIHGGQSKFVRPAHTEVIANYFTNFMLTSIRAAGHWVHAEAPDDTIALLKRYLDR